MGKQQILFLILGVCIIGVAMSVGAILVQPDGNVDYRHLMRTELMRLANAAQAYRTRPYESGGGDGTFLGLTATPVGISLLTQNRCTPFGEFFIARDGNAEFVQLVVIGKAPGNDPRKPMKMMLTVFTDHSSIAILN
jgi:hypothetical protein